MNIKYEHLEEWFNLENGVEQEVLLDLYLVDGREYSETEIDDAGFSPDQEITVIGGVVRTFKDDVIETTLIHELTEFLKTKKDTKETLHATLQDLTQEFIEKGGAVTCELSVGEISKNTALELLRLNAILMVAQPDNSEWKWVAVPCSVCYTHDTETPLHLEITKTKIEF